MEIPFFRRFFGRHAAADPTDYQALQSTPASLATEYQKLVAFHLQRWGVPERCTRIDVRKVREDRLGREVFVAHVEILKWERESALRLMLGLPLFEKKVRKALLGTWMAEVSHFEGLWLKASGELQDDAANVELRQLLVTLTGSRRSRPALAGDLPDSRP